MTIKQLIGILNMMVKAGDLSEDSPVAVFCGCKAFSDIVDLNPNGNCVQLNTAEAREMINNS